MADKSLEERVRAVEAQLAGKTLQEHFREQAELIDRLFIYRFDEMDTKWDAKLDAKLARFEEKWDAKLDAKLARFEEKWDAKLDGKLARFEEKLGAGFVGLENALESRLETNLETKLEAKLKPIRNDLVAVKKAVQIILRRLS